MYIDTHAHINSKFINSQDIDVEIKEIIQHNLSIVINVGTSLETSLENINIAKNYSIMYPTIGIHPNNDYHDNDLIKLKELVKKNRSKIVAIGETGLDFFHKPKSVVFSKQAKLLEFQTNLAIEFDLPLIIHGRNSLDELINYFNKKNNKKLRGIIHTFSGTYNQAIQFIKLGFYISFSGTVTFKNNLVTKEVAKKIPLKYLLTETDSPFLTPSPFRGKINHSYYVKYVVNEIAQLRGITINELINAIQSNTKKIFNI